MTVSVPRDLLSMQPGTTAPPSTSTLMVTQRAAFL